MKNILNKIDNYFQISKRGSTFSREIIGGVIVFFAMCYILPVNANILSATGMDYKAVFVATAICSALCTLFMGLIAKFPIALSAGMGINAFIAYTVCLGMGYSWQEAMTILIISGILFFVLSLTPLRQKIINGIPISLKYAISAGLGAFICFVGLKGAGIIQPNGSTFVQLGDLTNPLVLLGLGGIVLTFILLSLKHKVNRLAILIAMIATAVIGVTLGLCGVENMPAWSNETSSFSSLKGTIFEGFKHFEILLDPKVYAIIFALIFVNLFDTTATLLAVGQASNLIDEKGELKDAKKVIMADASGALISGIIGTSPITSFAESTVGVESGARTGLAATVTGLLFFLSIFLYPLFSIFAKVDVVVGSETLAFTPVTSLALVAVGALMFTHLRHIEWEDKIIVTTSFLIVIFMLLTYSITEGLGIGLIVYCLMMLAAKRGKEVNIVVYIISGFFLINFILSALVLS